MVSCIRRMTTTRTQKPPTLIIMEPLPQNIKNFVLQRIDNYLRAAESKPTTPTKQSPRLPGLVIRPEHRQPTIGPQHRVIPIITRTPSGGSLTTVSAPSSPRLQYKQFSPRTTPRPGSPIDQHYQFAKERPSTTRKLSEREVEKLWSSQNKFELPEDLQEYEGMQLDDPSNTPDLWEGPLPVPRPTSPVKRTPIEEITEDLLIEPRTPNPEPETNYPDDLYMEEDIKLEPPDPPVNTDTKQDPEPSKLPTGKLPKTTETTRSSGGGGGYFPPTKTRKMLKKKIPPPIQPKMKAGGLDQLREYNLEFKRWQLRLVGRGQENKETIKAYVAGLQSKILTVLLKDGYKFKEIETLAKWQKAAELAVARFERQAKQAIVDEKKLTRTPLQRLKEITVWKQMKQLSKTDRKKIIEELAIKFLEGEQLVAVIRKLDVDMMYISKKKSLQLPINIITYQGKQEDIALIDSGATNNFIDFRTVNKLGLGTRKIPRPIELYNVDGTHNQDGKIERSIHLYIDNGQQRIQTPFFVTNLGKDRIILGYPWFEAFNPKINWKEGKLLGPCMELKTTGAINQEHLNQVYEIQCTAMKIRKTTFAQKMAEKFQIDKPKIDNPIPPEYKRHIKVFSEQEAERFPPSRTWDHRIPCHRRDDEPLDLERLKLLSRMPLRRREKKGNP
jgi:hypothetical protein